jgi:FkbM family methyltransferase
MVKLTGLKKLLIPTGTRPARIFFGPFRGATIYMNTQDSLRKIFGVYEHELNGWLDSVLSQVDTVLDVGANDGYFTFGCAAAFRRLGKTADILSYEPQSICVQQLRASLRKHADPNVRITLEQTLVGSSNDSSTVTLNETGRRTLPARSPDKPARRALIKIDVEGAEMEVIEGASDWLRPEHFFLIEVHSEEYLGRLHDIFAATALTLDRHDQRPLPLLGAELRPRSKLVVGFSRRLT